MVTDKSYRSKVEQKVNSFKPKIKLMGSVKIMGDLEIGSKRIAKEFKRAVNKSGKKLRKELLDA